MIPGEYLLGDEPIEINAGRPTVRVEVTNRGDRPIQVGSHCHFFEVNRWLDFDRREAYGMRLDILAGTAVRFEPGDTRAVDLVALGGHRHVWRPERAWSRGRSTTKASAAGRSRRVALFTTGCK